MTTWTMTAKFRFKIIVCKQKLHSIDIPLNYDYFYICFVNDCWLVEEGYEKHILMTKILLLEQFCNYQWYIKWYNDTSNSLSG